MAVARLDILAVTGLVVVAGVVAWILGLARAMTPLAGVVVASAALALGLGWFGYRRWRGEAEAERRRRQSDERLAAVSEHVPGVVYSYTVGPGRPRTLEHVGPGLENLIGRAAAVEACADIDRLFDLIHADDREHLAHAADVGVRTGSLVDVEVRLRREDGGWRWVRSICRPRALPGGGSRWHILLIDITQQRWAYEEVERKRGIERLLFRELDHRVRNNLASLLHLIDLTSAAAVDVRAFAESIHVRVETMAHVHTMLSAAQWRFVDLRALVERLVPPGHGAAVEIAGPVRHVTARQAPAAGMVFQELFTNSLKHGALSADGGMVKVGWTVDASDPSAVDLCWTESGGPRIEAEPAFRTGMSLIRGFVETELRGSAVPGFRVTGAEHRFRLHFDEPSLLEGTPDGDEDAAVGPSQRERSD